MIRIVAAIAGMVLIGSAAHATIIATGGYGHPAALVTMAMALGVAVGAVAIGSAAGHGRIALAVAIAAGLLAGEGYALLGTAERVIVQRDEAQAPLRYAAERHRAAKADLDAALAARPAPPDRSRLTAAEARLATASAAVVAAATDRGCAANCRTLLQAGVDAAEVEVGKARAEIEIGERAEAGRLARRIADARTAFEAAPMPPSATPLADRLRIDAWLLDLIAAALLSLGVNGLGGALLALAGHAPKIEAKSSARRGTAVRVIEASTVIDAPPPVADATPAVEPELPVELDKPRLVASTPTKPGSPDLILDMIEPCESGGRLELAEVYALYAEACRDAGVPALTPERFVTPLQRLCRAHKIGSRVVRDKVYLLGVRRVSTEARA